MSFRALSLMESHIVPIQFAQHNPFGVTMGPVASAGIAIINIPLLVLSYTAVAETPLHSGTSG
jgi:hypothetical protein